MAGSAQETIDNEPNLFGSAYWPEGVEAATPNSVLFAAWDAMEVLESLPEHDVTTVLALNSIEKITAEYLLTAHYKELAPQYARELNFQFNTNAFILNDLVELQDDRAA